MSEKSQGNPQASPKREDNRSVLMISAILLIVALFIALTVALVGDGENNSTATASADTQQTVQDAREQNQPGDGGSVPAPQDMEQYPVTIIVVDDFDLPLRQVVAELLRQDREGVRFDALAERIQNDILPQYGEERGPEVYEAINAAMREAIAEKPEFRQQVLGTEALNLGGQDPAETRCAVDTEVLGVYDVQGTGVYDVQGTGVYDVQGTGVYDVQGTMVFVLPNGDVIVGDGLSLWEQPHGVRVESELNELNELIREQTAVDIRIVRMPVQGLALPDNVATLSQITERALEETPRVVVNMSFALVPCEVMPDIVAYDLLFSEYFQSESVIQRGVMQPETLQALEASKAALYYSQLLTPASQEAPGYDDLFCERNPAGGDSPLCNENFIVQGQDPASSEPPEPGDEPMIIFVAASGNGMRDANGQFVSVPFPFYPAGWPQVIAVSASADRDHFIDAQPPRTWYSNPGRVLMQGTWPPQTQNGVLDQFPQTGTSFAAPRYSFNMALWLAAAQGIDLGCGQDVIYGPVLARDWLSNPPPANLQDVPYCDN